MTSQKYEIIGWSSAAVIILVLLAMFADRQAIGFVVRETEPASGPPECYVSDDAVVYKGKRFTPYCSEDATRLRQYTCNEDGYVQAEWLEAPPGQYCRYGKFESD